MSLTSWEHTCKVWGITRLAGDSPCLFCSAEPPNGCPECGGSKPVRLVSHIDGYPIGPAGVCGNVYHHDA